MVAQVRADLTLETTTMQQLATQSAYLLLNPEVMFDPELMCLMPDSRATGPLLSDALTSPRTG